jgi:AraC-like DNA-binding protein
VQRDLLHYPAAEAPDPTAIWLTAAEGVFALDGAMVPGPSPTFRLRPGAATVVSASCCQQAVLTRRPRPLDGRLLDHCGLRLILSGAMGVGESGNLELAAPGDLVFIDLSQPVRLEYAGKEPTAELTLWVPRGHQAIGSRAPGSLHGRLLRAGDPAAAVVGAALRALHAELDRLAPPDLDQLVGGIFGLGMTRMLASADAAAPPPSGLESFATICRYIETNLAASDLGVARLARTFGLSRASLYRLFEPVGGVASYVRARRLNRARQELLAAGLDNRRIGPIAFQSGFRSVAAFNRAFREAYGEPPRDARKHRARTPSASPVTSAEIGTLAAALLRIVP